MVSLRDKATRLDDAENECERTRNRNNELLDTVKKLENAMDRQKAASREKHQGLECELEETRMAMQKQRNDALESYEDLKKMMVRNEEALKEDLSHAERVNKDQKDEFEKFSKR